MQFDSIMVLDINEKRSSLIRRLEYDEQSRVLTVFFRPDIKPCSFEGVHHNHFSNFLVTPSVGKYYLHFIKPNFKQTKLPKMSDEKKKLPTKNVASDKKRFIKISINVREIKKEWLHEGEGGTYLNLTLQMLPDGQLDRYGNLGMVTQDVPSVVYEAEKQLPKAKKTLGPILGNGCEFDWQSTGGSHTPGSETGKLYGENGEEIVDDLPF